MINIQLSLKVRNYNKVIITPLKDYKFPHKYFKGVSASIPKDMNVSDIINLRK